MEFDKNQIEQLDRFEQTLEDGFVKICKMAGLMDEMVGSPDMDAKWEEFVKEYLGDAVSNFNDYPNAALGFAAYLGMALANVWDKDWTAHKDDSYVSFYGSSGFDNMDDHIVEDVLHLKADYAKKLSDAMLACVTAALGLISHEGIETHTAFGFYVLVRCCTAMFKTGVSVELTRLGYKKVPLPHFTA